MHVWRSNGGKYLKTMLTRLNKKGKKKRKRGCVRLLTITITLVMEMVVNLALPPFNYVVVNIEYGIFFLPLLVDSFPLACIVIKILPTITSPHMKGPFGPCPCIFFPVLQEIIVSN